MRWNTKRDGARLLGNYQTFLALDKEQSWAGFTKWINAMLGEPTLTTEYNWRKRYRLAKKWEKKLEENCYFDVEKNEVVVTGEVTAERVQAVMAEAQELYSKGAGTVDIPCEHEQPNDKADEPIPYDVVFAISCKDCAFFEETEDNSRGGECRRKSVGPGGFPTTKPEWWCGEHSEKWNNE